MRGNITITLRVSPQRAIQIYNRLYASGEMSREKWLQNIANVNAQNAVMQKNNKEKAQEYKTFYKNISKKRH